MIYVFIGPPGSGKGTQSALLAKRLNLPHIATGHIIRDAISQSSVLGVKAKSFVEKGDLLPDADVINIIKERVAQRDCANGFIMDGFPRTSAQAKVMDKVIMEMGKEITKVVTLEIPEEILIQRLSGRRVCRRCGTNYHLTFTPPKVADKCDRCGGEIYQREDDKTETLQKRLRVYAEQTASLIDYYQDRLININGNDKIGAIETHILDKLKIAH